MTLHVPRWMEVGPPVRAYRRTDQTTRCCDMFSMLVVSDSGKRQSNYCHVRLRWLNESELIDEAAKSPLVSKRASRAGPREVQRSPVYRLHGIRC